MPSIAEGPISKIDDDISTVRRSLEFLSPSVQDFDVPMSIKEVHDLGSG